VARFFLPVAVVAVVLAPLVSLSGCQTHRAPSRSMTPIEAERRPYAWPTTQPFAAMPRANVLVELGAERGPLETFRHTVGVGGINPLPLTDRVADGVRKLRPRLVRIFIQEFFAVYPEHGRYDWSKLDRYMDSLAKTDAKIVAAITIKPRPLYPAIDATIWRPSDVTEWQRVIAALVKRYSVDRKLVTYWEIGNETDIGETGGCPYHIKDVRDYLEYYKMTTQAVVAAFPDARVGGAAVANASGEYLPEFIRLCLAQHVRLDFISWHLYSDDPRAHVRLIEKYAQLVKDFPGTRPEMLITEWSKGFERVSVEEQAHDPRRAAITAAAIIAMTDAAVDWSFYYHTHDQTAYWNDFARFFRDPNIMYHHWNEVPHRFGLFGDAGDVRPQYFVYQMLARMPATRVAARCDDDDLRVMAARQPGRAGVLLSNYALPTSRDRIATLRFTGLAPRRKRLVIFRIDRGQAWSSRRLELIPVESRETDARTEFTCQAYCPADSVTMVELEDR
jgi:hypothetical protein